MTRTALYVRTSTRQQDPDLQLVELRQVAAQRGWEVVGTYEDAGVSGTKARRPGLDRMLADAQAGKLDLVAVWKLDRLARSLPHLLEVMGQLESWGVQLVSSRDAGIDTTTPMGRLISQLLGAFAEFERSLIRERVQAGVDRARERGVVLGRPRVELSPAEALAAIEAHGGLRPAAKALGIGRATLERRRREALDARV